MAADPAERTVARVVDHIEHVASVAGTAHVGLGPDFVHEGLPLVTAELIRRGHPEKDIEAVHGGNVHRLFRAELGRPR
ncbi:membrane dipeptidase [Streptomyces uncialis]|uniref:membrane dipeptidase n=1 Tax=Streptomyces uncialis TaxID=1048205 RepID=UPI00382EBCAB